MQLVFGVIREARLLVDIRVCNVCATKHKARLVPVSDPARTVYNIHDLFSAVLLHGYMDDGRLTTELYILDLKGR